MLPGKKYTPEVFLQIAWKRKWWIVLPALLISAGTAVWTYTLPDRYSASTTVLVVPQRVPEDFVRSTVTAEVSERLQTIAQQILSRTRLERIIEELNLYEEERETMIMEDIVERMRTQDIDLDVATPRRRGDTTHFSVSFASSNPRIAMQVADRVASMFVQENLQDRAILADSTNQFLQAQLEDARRRLMEHEAKLEAFKQRNAGRLPDQVASNLQRMQITQSQIQANVDAAARERDRLAAVEASLADALAAPPPLTVENAGSNGVPAGTAAQQLEAAKKALENLERRLKPTHPDIVRMKRIITDLEVKAAEELVQQTSGDGSELPEKTLQLPPAMAAKVTGLRVSAEQLRRSLETRKREDERLRSVMATYQARLEETPKLEAELTELMRDYQTLDEQYQSLLAKSEDSRLALNLERRQIGEQFKIIDSARLPQRPISPNRLRLNLMGLLAGLGLGVALVALLEYRDTTLKTDDDVVVSLALPVLAVIPAMSSAADRRRAKRRKILLAASASAVIVLAVAGAIAAWRLDLLRDWIP